MIKNDKITMHLRVPGYKYGVGRVTRKSKKTLDTNVFPNVYRFGKNTRPAISEVDDVSQPYFSLKSQSNY